MPYANVVDYIVVEVVIAATGDGGAALMTYTSRVFAAVPLPSVRLCRCPSPTLALLWRGGTARHHDARHFSASSVAGGLRPELGSDCFHCCVDSLPALCPLLLGAFVFIHVVTELLLVDVLTLFSISPIQGHAISS